ncbi:TPA: hypothetical protein DDZ86_03290 [Candidatus Dependentiae bacterium]|nr:MAG: hypothetical protein UW09_C0003G0011 [candidate division TM6 bacterium GW2011_GWF2_43_87]HBL98641.1 hypothetical protein [Candidatus Dependentiae bacterium]
MKIVLLSGGVALACFLGVYGVALTPLEKVCSDKSGRDEVCEVRLKNCFQDARQALMRTWGVVDVMRSITIAPAYRIRFIQWVVDDVITMVTSVSALACCCEWCSGCHCKIEDDFLDLSDRLGCLNEAFEAVCAEKKCGEESMVGRLLERTSQLLRQGWNSFSAAGAV